MRNRYLEIWKEIGNRCSIIDIGGRKGELLKNCPFKFEGKYKNFDIIDGNDILSPIKIREKFDFVVFSHVIEHIDNQNIALENIKKVLKNKGKLIICIPNALSLRKIINYILGRRLESYGGFETHLVCFNLETIKNLLEKHGFKCLKARFLDKPINIGKFSEEILIVAKKNR